jgi:hypothetical protein
MSVYLQIGDDPTQWWPTDPFQASQLTGQPLSIPVSSPLQATLVLSGTAASVAVFNQPSAPVGPAIEPQAPSIYVPTSAGLSAGHVGYELPADVNLQNLASQIVATMQSGSTQTITLGGTGGTLVLNGATLSFVVICQQSPSTTTTTTEGPMPHD